MRSKILPWTLVLLGACEPVASKKVEPRHEVATPVVATPEPVVATPEPVVATPRPEGPGSLTEAVLPGGRELDGAQVEVTRTGGWEHRKVVGGGGVGGGGVAMAPSPRRMAASEGLAKGGFGSGGGGASDGIGGLGGARPEKVGGRPEKVKEVGPLKAGSTDDNVDFKGFLAFLDSWTQRPEVEGQFQPLAVEGRQYVRVLDSDGQPIPSALVRVRDAGGTRELWRARTYGDGRAPFYPKVWGAQVQGSGSYVVEVEAEGSTLRATWNGKDELVLRTGQARRPGPMALEVLFLIDTTGSMGDEIEQIKTTLLAVTGKVKTVRSDLELRYGAVLYKDVHDEYVTMAYPFTADLPAFNTALQGVTAGGGGDLPESLNQGLERAVSGVPWQAEAAKLVFLVCDAAPQMRLKGDVLYGDSAVQAVARGIRIHAVAASGLDELGTLVLRQLAQLTRGKFIFIEYGGTQASAASHGVAGPVQGGNNLDDIIAREITAEIEGWGRG